MPIIAPRNENVLCVGWVGVIKMYITAQPDHVLIFYATSMDPHYGGSAVKTPTTTPNETRQRRHALSTQYLILLHLPPGLYRYMTGSALSPPRNALPVIPSFPTFTVVCVFDINLGGHGIVKEKSPPPIPRIFCSAQF